MIARSEIDCWERYLRSHFMTCSNDCSRASKKSSAEDEVFTRELVKLSEFVPKEERWRLPSIKRSSYVRCPFVKKTVNYDSRVKSQREPSIKTLHHPFISSRGRLWHQNHIFYFHATSNALSRRIFTNGTTSLTMENNQIKSNQIKSNQIKSNTKWSVHT
jgi:hypothetical protein